ncbi:Uncharacterised protein [Campylobacter jejuni]|nr:Uncharacterised protein [Campylobacter jejuni]
MKINILSGALATAYLILCSALYLWVFWLYFDINILQFIDSSDIIKAAALPAIPVITFSLVHFAIQQYNISTTEQRTEFREAGGFFKVFSYVQLIYLIIVIAIGLLAFGYMVYIFFTGTLPKKYSSFAFLAGSILSYFLINKDSFLEDWGKARVIAILSICYLPTYMMQSGIQEAEKIISGKDTYLISSNLSCSKNEKDKYRYIATLSDKIFSISLTDNSICIQHYEFLSLSKEKDALPLTGLVIK